MSAIPSFSEYAAEILRFIEASYLEVCFRDKVAQDSPRGGAQRFNELALGLFALQVGANPLYARYCASQGKLPGNIDAWQDIPAVPISVFKDYRFSTLPEREGTTVFFSSGTTKQKCSRHFHNEDSLAVYEASLAAWFRRSLLPEMRGWGHGESSDERSQFVFLTPEASRAPHSSLVHMCETLRRKFASPDSIYTGELDEAGGWRLDWEKTLSVLQATTETGRAVVVVGTGFGFIHLLDAMAEQGIRVALPEKSRIMETGGYKGRSRQVAKTKLHAMIEEWLGAGASYIVSEYGMSELSSQAYDRIAGRASWEGESTVPHESEGVFCFPPWSRMRIVSPETGHEVKEGEVGLISIMDLANMRSAMAIETEDLGRRKGVGFEFVGRAVLAEPRGCSLMSV